MEFTITDAGVLSLGHAAEGILQVFSSWLKRWQEVVLTPVTPKFCPVYGALFYVEHFSSTATDSALCGTQRSKSTWWAEPNTQNLPGNRGVQPRTAHQPALATGLRPCLGQRCVSRRLPSVAPWTAVQNTRGCFPSWLLTLEHRDHNLFWKCKSLCWPAAGCSAIPCQAPSF